MSVPPDAFRVSPAAKTPPAPAVVPVGFGTSLPEARVALNATAWASESSQRALPSPDHTPATNSPTTITPTPSLRLFIRPPRNADLGNSSRWEADRIASEPHMSTRRARGARPRLAAVFLDYLHLGSRTPPRSARRM